LEGQNNLKPVPGDVREELLQKIYRLFEFRKIPWLLQHSKVKERDVLTQHLVDLQIAIYELDNHLESHWVINPIDLKPYWLNIYQCLAKMNLSLKQQHDWTKEITTYQRRELDLRQQKSPLTHSIEELYYYKSCDVRLMRRLIYRADEDLNKLLKFSEWTEFDLITEVNDDVEDLYEDLTALNGNRFLFSLYELGLEETRRRYEDFLDEKISGSRKRMLASSSVLADQMHIWIQEIAVHTKEFLSSQTEDWQSESLDDARIISHYKSVRPVSGC
jgi:hypothetical protein